jgi:hypothetical protein
MTTEGFSLAALIRRTAQESGEIEPALVSKLVLGSLPPAEQETALAEALSAYVRQVLSHDRPKGGFTLALRDSSRGAVNSGNSDRVRRIREAMLDSAYAVAGCRKRLRDCTAGDLVVIALGMESQAGKLAAKAEEFRFLAGLLEREQVTTVGELPPAIISQLVV